MKKKNTFYFGVTLAVLFFSLNLPAQQRALQIQFYSGEPRYIALEALSKMTFSADHLLLEYADKRTEEIGILTMKELSFASVTGVEDFSFDDRAVFLYPNPAVNHIVLENLSVGKNTIEIYSVAGDQVLSVRSSGGSQTLDVSTLSKGLYVLKVKGQILRFMKR